MNNNDAARILTLLARGVDPTTGEILKVDGPLANVDVVRALFLAAEALSGNASIKIPRAKPEGKKPARQGKPWTIEEDEKLRISIASGTRAHLIAKAHERSRGAIVARIEHLGLLPTSPEDQIYDSVSDADA